MFIRHNRTIVEKVIDQGEKLQPELRELTIGRRTIISLLSFGVGTVLIGNFIWNLFHTILGPWVTGAIGFLMFLIGGLMTHEFRK